MTKEEFLDGLMKALASTGSQSLIAENIRFYSSYIDDELSKGRSIGEIMEELGDPRLIANSIKVAAGYDDVFVGIDNETYENTAGKTGNYEENDDNFSDRKDNSFKTYNFSGNSLIIPIIIAIAVLVVIVAVVAAVFSFLAPVLLPVIGVLILVALIKGIFGKGNYKF
ncbi:DUF1700 domain-containing protein [Lachnoanaerobaculum gingivalis]|uniref:DUF1700 domain-containing protein n=1 Tax=Lachnoanaerobaculum gingivalis TaxID=2490855 RepID=UPI0024A716D8|nr:DUF1700 domain-containing protein [Lachnoanaerobaculum gingivalis]WHE87396.1 DUF1700 domain-containing protein [Lachnoanaerobaculum gingivalis]